MNDWLNTTEIQWGYASQKECYNEETGQFDREAKVIIKCWFIPHINALLRVEVLVFFIKSQKKIIFEPADF